jgi:hypothetical protein
MRLLIISEDSRTDQDILKPVIEALMGWVGRRCSVHVADNPPLGGVGEALKWNRIAGVLDQYRGMYHVFLLIVDRDCDAGRQQRLRELEALASAELGPGKHFIAENAWQEIEVWALGGLKDFPSPPPWRDVRAECHPKEAHYQPHVARRGLNFAEARVILARESASNYKRLRTRCRELRDIEDRIQTALGA